jgi:hypothetical protein
MRIPAAIVALILALVGLLAPSRLDGQPDPERSFANVA